MNSLKEIHLILIQEVKRYIWYKFNLGNSPKHYEESRPHLNLDEESYLSGNVGGLTSKSRTRKSSKNTLNQFSNSS